MKVTWLGQAGLLFEVGETKVVIDPYLSDSCQKVNPKSVRKIPVDDQFLALKPDVLILTHKHLDHTDPETLKYFLKSEEEITVLAPKGTWENVREFKGNHNYVMFNRQTEFTSTGMCFKAVSAEHSDENAIGICFECDKKVFYVAGDTLYNNRIFDELPGRIDYAFLPVNGKGNNMNFEDAERFVKKCGAVNVVPIHWGMFDNISESDVKMENSVILTPYITKVI